MMKGTHHHAAHTPYGLDCFRQRGPFPSTFLSFLLLVVFGAARRPCDDRQGRGAVGAPRMFGIFDDGNLKDKRVGLVTGWDL